MSRGADLSLGSGPGIWRGWRRKKQMGWDNGMLCLLPAPGVLGLFCIEVFPVRSGLRAVRQRCLVGTVLHKIALDFFKGVVDDAHLRI